MARKYFVDWSDQAYPTIRPAEDATEYSDPLTLAEAKREIINHFQYIIDHGRNMIARTRATRAADVQREHEGGE